MFANYHTHTFRCHHARGEDREYVEAAISAGMKVLGFSDHCPWIFPNGYVSDIRMTPAETEDYFRSLTDLKSEYASDIRIYIGFEAEYIPELIEAQDRFLENYPVDYMILGQHSYAPEYISPYTGDPTDNISDLVLYTDLVIEGMRSGRYKYLAHPDLINFTGSTEEYEKQMSRICDHLKENDSPVEINLFGLLENRNYPDARFLRLAGERGCKAILGCDAHVRTMLTDAGLAERGRKLAEKFGLTVIDRIKGME